MLFLRGEGVAFGGEGVAFGGEGVALTGDDGEAAGATCCGGGN